MTLSGSGVYSRRVPVPKMPPGLVELMEGLTKDVLKHNPQDVFEFCANHVHKLLEIRDGPSAVKTISLDQRIKRAQEVVRKRAEQRCRSNNDTMLSGFNEKISQKVLNPVHHDNDLTNSSEIEISCQPGDTISAIQYLEETKHVKDDDEKERDENKVNEVSEGGKVECQSVQIEKKNPENADVSENVIFVENSKETELLQSQQNGILGLMETKNDHFENPTKIKQYETLVAQNIVEKDTDIIRVDQDITAVTNAKDKITLQENLDTMNSTNDFRTNVENESNIKEAIIRNNTEESGKAEVEISVTKPKIQSTEFDTLTNNTVAEQKIEKLEITTDLSTLLKIPDITINEQRNEENATNIEGNDNILTLEKKEIKEDKDIDALNLDKDLLTTVNVLKFEDANENKQATLLNEAMSTLTLPKPDQQIADMKDVLFDENPDVNVTVTNKILTLDQGKDVHSINLTESDLKKDTSDSSELRLIEVNQTKEVAVPTIVRADETKNDNASNLKVQDKVCAEDIPFDVEPINHNIRLDIVLQVKEEVKDLENEKGTYSHQSIHKEDDKIVAEINTNDKDNNLLINLEKDSKQKTEDLVNAQIEQYPKVDVVIEDEKLQNSSYVLPNNNVYTESTVSDKKSIGEVLKESIQISERDTNQEQKIIDDSLQQNIASINQSDIEESKRPKRDIEHITAKKSIETVQGNNTDNVSDLPSTADDCGTEETSSISSIVENGAIDCLDESAPNDGVNTMDLETAAVTIQKVFRTFLFKSRASTFEDSNNDNNISDDDIDQDNKDTRPFQTSTISKDRRNLGISRMDTVLQTVNEEKSLSLSTDDSSTLSSAATIIQAHVRGFLVRNKLNSGKTASSTNSLINSEGQSTTSIEGEGDQHKNKTILNIHIVPEGNNFLSRDESIITSMDLSLDGSPPSSVNLHPLGYDKSERRKQLKREDAIQSVSPPSNNSGKLSDDIESVKELPSNSGSIANTSLDHDTVTAVLSDDNINAISNIDSNHTTPDNNIVESLENLNVEKSDCPEPVQDKVRNTLTKQSSDETDVVTPYKGNTPRDSDTSSRLLHSGEFHDTVLPTKVSRSDTPVVSGE